MSVSNGHNIKLSKRSMNELYRYVNWYRGSDLSNITDSLLDSAYLVALNARELKGDDALQACAIMASGTVYVKDAIIRMNDIVITDIGSIFNKSEKMNIVKSNNQKDITRKADTVMSCVDEATVLALDIYNSTSNLHAFISEHFDDFGGDDNDYIGSIMAVLAMAAADVKSANVMLGAIRDGIVNESGACQ